MEVARAQELINRFAGRKILVAGDLMLDEFIWGNVSRISPEAPVPVVEVTGHSFYAGGAANVARNLAEFTRGASVMGLTGDDDEGRKLRALLDEAGIATGGILQTAAQRTIVKTRVIARHQQVVRIDRENRMTPGESQSAELRARLEADMPALDAVILSDYAKGFLTQGFASACAALAARHGKIATVDPSPKNPVEWRGMTAVKPNYAEAIAAAGLPPGADAEDAGARLLARWNAGMILVTLGEKGMTLLRAGHPPHRTPARAREVFDVSGAGDTAIAVFTLALAAGGAPEEAAELANHASGVVVGKLGTATLTPSELLESVQERHVR
jgi:D-beta-D-heptose 7-phosphate kinase/D-beta-D-heptose 1-phosphate adenosyltransferase